MKISNCILMFIFTIGLSNCTPTSSQTTKKIKVLIPGTYELTSKERYVKPIKIINLWESNVEHHAFGMVRQKHSIPRTEETINNGRYISKNGCFSVAIPFLSTGKITIDQSEIRKGIDYQVRFYESGVNNNIPWHAVVVSTPLPPEWKDKESRFFQVVKEMQFNIVSSSPKNSFYFSKISGKYGLLWQTIIINRIPSVQYPGSKALIIPYSKEGYKTVGINRIGYINGRLVEIGIIVAKPYDIPESEFMDYALKEMDIFHSGLKIL
jgi:hypothetical protein